MAIPIIVLGVALVMMLCEAARPGRSFPQVAGWWLRAALLNGIEVSSVYVAGLVWDRWFATHRPWSADSLGRLTFVSSAGRGTRWACCTSGVSGGRIVSGGRSGCRGSTGPLTLVSFPTARFITSVCWRRF